MQRAVCCWLVLNAHQSVSETNCTSDKFAEKAPFRRRRFYWMAEIRINSNVTIWLCAFILFHKRLRYKFKFYSRKLKSPTWKQSKKTSDKKAFLTKRTKRQLFRHSFLIGFLTKYVCETAMTVNSTRNVTAFEVFRHIKDRMLRKVYQRYISYHRRITEKARTGNEVTVKKLILKILQADFAGLLRLLKSKCNSDAVAYDVHALCLHPWRTGWPWTKIEIDTRINIPVG